MGKDIIFKTDEYVFSYKVAGLLLHNGEVLLQKIPNDIPYWIKKISYWRIKSSRTFCL